MYTGLAGGARAARAAAAGRDARASGAASAGSERGHGAGRGRVRVRGVRRQRRQVRRRVGLVQVERGVDHGGVVQQPQARRAQAAAGVRRADAVPDLWNRERGR